jgi:hypothetical protein
MNKSKVYNYYKYLSVVLCLLALTIFTLDIFGVGHAFFNGFATSILGVGLILMVVLIIKRKDPDFKSDLDQMASDERVKQQYLRRHCIMNHVLLVLIIIFLTVSVFYDYPFQVGGGILLWVHIIGMGLLWLKDTKN